METLHKQTSLFTEGKLTSSLEVSHANHTAGQVSDLEKKTNATCGPKCLEQLGKFNHVGLWAKTFSALLIGREDWYSTKSKLNWKLRGTKYSRMYFQLVPSTPRTGEIGFGLLPTPTASDKAADMNSASQLNRGTISGAIQRAMLPTPKAGDWKDTGSIEMLCNLRETSGQFAIVRELAHIMNDQGHGSGSLKLNPQFVGEMMGFPLNWTESPFLSGETNQSKPTEMPSCHK